MKNIIFSHFRSEKHGKLSCFLFSVLVCVFTLALFVLIHQLGFGSIVERVDERPERLSDITFPIWDTYPVRDHLFLTYLKPVHIEEKIVYVHHSYGFLFFMYALNRIANLLGVGLRAIYAYLCMALSVFMIAYITLKEYKQNLHDIGKLAVFLAALAAHVSMSVFWLGVGGYNVDNTMSLFFPAFLFVSYAIYKETYSVKFLCCFSLFVTFFLCTFFPILIGLYYFFMMFFKVVPRTGKTIKVMVFTVFAGLFFRALPIVVAIINGRTLNRATFDSFLFRSGLDGDASRYSDAISAVFSPAHPRPAILVIVPFIPLIILGFLLLLKKQVQEQDSIPYVTFHVLVSPYLLTLLFFPQAITIHPYLYDYLLIAPATVIVIFNLLNTKLSPGYRMFWFLLLAFIVMFNLTKIAQYAKNFEYPLYKTFEQVSLVSLKNK